MDPAHRMHAERTPNPNSVKWVIEERPVTGDSGYASFAAAPGPDVSPLAARLFSIAGITRVLLGPDFVTLGKDDATPWSELAEPVVAALIAWSDAGEPAVGEAFVASRRDGQEGVESRIREILEQEIEPYVAQDGGEITLVRYRDGIVEVRLRGACEGCPSSSVTLKLGIEARLREAIPEVASVVAV